MYIWKYELPIWDVTNYIKLIMQTTYLIYFVSKIDYHGKFMYSFQNQDVYHSFEDLNIQYKHLSNKTMH